MLSVQRLNWPTRLKSVTFTKLGGTGDRAGAEGKPFGERAGSDAQAERAKETVTTNGSTHHTMCPD
jgi:hypothetical protein